ncbi:C-_U-editing enzyme APOBEC-2 isoform X2 [Zonotrichia leucophrys gambelii]|uniref:C->U-editing enzyme APOBEC-2 isoform X2 n=1 Tax=Zonotrichia leucophrys gambelii TaxID=257770 RepID=UPI00313FF624
MLQWPQLGPSVLGKMAEKQEEPSNAQNGEPDNAEEGEGKKKKVKREDLPPFEIVTGERLPAIFFKFQFRNVEYSSGRNKTFLCYVVETQGKEPVTSRGYLEDEHAAAHAEMAFFNTILPTCQPGARHDVTWYVSSSPCVTCAQRICEALRKDKGLRLTIMVGRLFMWEEPEMQAALRSMKEAGCKLRIMKPQDFEYVWKNFVEQEEGEEAKSFVPWEDIQENFQYYEEKLAEILH